MADYIDAAITDVLDRLGDLDNDYWSRSEIKQYYKDGYDQFCRQTKCLFDVHVIPNQPVVGNYQTDFERYYAENKPGMGLTDEPMSHTANYLRDKGTEGRYAPSYPLNPTPGTSPHEATGKKGSSTTSNGYFGANSTGSITTALPTQVRGGRLPNSTVEIMRVAYDHRDLPGMEPMHLRQLDPNYEDRNGDPQWYTYGKDGLFFLRLVPIPNGDATYEDVDGSWGVMRQTDITGATVDTVEVSGKDTGGWGLLRHESGSFGAGGRWGTVKRRHPIRKNIKVELTRLGRDLDSHEIELPTVYQKYILFWAMYRALGREGHGQDLDRADHYRQRFEMGVDRMNKNRGHLDDEYYGKLAGRQLGGPEFGLGDPQAPYPYGIPHWREYP
jgi:hypothetical protein